MNKLLLIIGLLSVSGTFLLMMNQPLPGQFHLPVQQSNAHNTAQNTTQEPPFFYTDFASHESTLEVHSATAIELNDNNIMAFWYGGTREGHKDVSIYSNVWHSKTRQWGQDSEVITRESTKESTARYIRKLGNPVVTRGPDNAIWLFYVSVSVGGWAGSSINLTRSFDEGQSWSPARRLISSPFLNLSTLIKGTPIHYDDDTLGLPVYHEFLGKFGELLKLNAAGEVIDKIRLSWGKTSLQPIIFATAPETAIAMMRFHGEAPKRILTQSSTDSGINWTTAQKSTLPNPDAGIIGLMLQETLPSSPKKTRQLLLAFNNDDEEREDMSLASSVNDGRTWTINKTVEEKHLPIPDKNQQFAYPWLLQTQDGTIHLLYTWHKSHIKHVIFNSSWLNSSPQTGVRNKTHEVIKP